MRRGARAAAMRFDHCGGQGPTVLAAFCVSARAT